MPITTPLLLLLDSILCQDSEQFENASHQVSLLLGHDHRTPHDRQNLMQVLEELVATNPRLPEIANERDHSYPLHFAASIGDVEVAEFLFNKYPLAASTPNDKGKIPLHYAAREGRTDMVQFLLRVEPTTASIRSKKDKLALHFASGEGHLEVVRALLAAHPSGVSTPSAKGKLPIHFAARWGHLRVAQHLLALYPGGVEFQDWDGSLPLHDAAREGQAVMCQFLADYWPQGLQTTNLREEIPLFSAVRSGNLAVVVSLLKGWPDGGKDILCNLTESDAVQDWDWNILELCLRGASGNFNGCTLLNLKTVCSLCGGMIREAVAECGSSCSSEYGNDESWPKKRSALSSLSLSKKRLRASESVTRQECPCPFSPLHAALRANSDPRVLRVVMDRARDQVTMPDCVGALPIHAAVSRVTNYDTMQLVMDQILSPFPDSAMARDNHGRLPLHVALESKAHFVFVKALIEACPESAVEPCNFHDARFASIVPFSLAVAKDCSIDTIYFLLRCDPSVLKLSLTE